MWKFCNDRHFNSIKMDHTQVAMRSHYAFGFVVVISTTNQDLIKQNFLRACTIKINLAGCTFGNYGWIAYGGLAKDDRARWIEGFCGTIGYGTPLQAELWGIRRAMKLPNKIAWLETIIEIDYLTTVNLINMENTENHLDKTMIQDCKKLKETQRLELINVRR